MTTGKRRILIATIPLILVNLTAFSGQFGYIRDHVHWILPGQLMLSISIESIALFLTAMAHEALKSEDTAYGLRAMSYFAALIVAALNYSHYSVNGKPTFLAIATGLCSLASPYLWGVYSRRVSRDSLRAKGLIESRAVRLGTLRWLFWPSRAFPVYRNAIWTGENNPTQAITAWEESEESKKNAMIAAESAAEPVTLAAAHTKADAIRIAVGELGEALPASAVAEWLAERGWSVTPAHVRAIRSQSARSGNATLIPLPGRAPIAAIRERGTDDQEKHG